MSTESILKSVIEIKDDEAAQKLLDVLERPVSKIPRPSTDTVRGLDGVAEYIEHALVANNFVIKIGSQMVVEQGRVFERVRYRLPENNFWDIVPDVSIVVDVEKRTEIAFTNVPCFVMEIVASEWERVLCKKKMEVYYRAKVPECWVADWNMKSVEIYCFADECEDIEAGLQKVVTEVNKDELRISTFPKIEFSYEELFKDV